MARWMAEMMTKKTFGDKLKQILRLKLNYLPPIIALLRGLTDPNVGLNMGQTAENIVNRFKFTRDELDAFSLRSHQKAHLASEQGVLAERIPVYDSKGKLYNIDDGVRGDSSLEKLAKLKPFFDKPFGTITPGNSSQITDGAAALLLASDEAVKRYNLPVLARLQPTQWVGNSPREMGLAPAFAIPKLLNQNNLAPENIDYWEINEAFAAQVMGVQEALRDKSYCQDYIGLDDSYADIPDDKLNIYGGAVALGHPVGASGARIVLTLANILRKKESRLGVASICIGGGQGGAVLVENTGGQVA
jgi:acetyl-CoA C-acetyltransferase